MKMTSKLFEEFWRIDGAKFKGSMVDSPLTLAQNGAYPPRLLIVQLPTFIQAGDTIKNKSEEVFLLLQYPTLRARCQTFRAMQATETFTWKRRVNSVDPVSEMPRSQQIDDLGVLYATYQHLKGGDFEGFMVSKKSFWTGQNVQANDLIDDCPILKIEESMGAKLVTVR